MRDLIVQWLTQITAPFWKSSLSIDQFITALQETFHMVFFAMLFGCIWGFIQAIILLVTRPDGILPKKATYHSLNPIVNALALSTLYYFADCGFTFNQTHRRNIDWHVGCNCSAHHLCSDQYIGRLVKLHYWK